MLHSFPYKIATSGYGDDATNASEIENYESSIIDIKRSNIISSGE